MSYLYLYLYLYFIYLYLYFIYLYFSEVFLLYISERGVFKRNPYLAPFFQSCSVFSKESLVAAEPSLFYPV